MKPSEAIAAGLCPSCLGTGRVVRFVPVGDEYACSTCGGDGEWPPLDWRCGRLLTHLVYRGHLVPIACGLEQGHDGQCAPAPRPEVERHTLLGKIAKRQGDALGDRRDF